MPTKPQHTIILKYVSMFIALLLLNCSIDSPDYYTRHIPENLTINDQESLIELVIEKGFGYDNAIPEYDDVESDEGSFGKAAFSLDCFILSSVNFSFKNTYTCTKNRVSIYYTGQPVNHYQEIHSPPPEA